MERWEWPNLFSYKHWYLIHTWSGKTFKCRLVNRALLSLHGGSLEITLTLPYARFSKDYENKNCIEEFNISMIFPWRGLVLAIIPFILLIFLNFRYFYSYSGNFTHIQVLLLNSGYFYSNSGTFTQIQVILSQI